MSAFEPLRGTVSKKDLKALVWEEWIALVRRSPGMQGHGGKQEGSVGQGSGSVAPAFQPTNAWEAWVAEQTTITRQIDFIVIKAVEKYVIPKLLSKELDLQAFGHETPGARHQSLGGARCMCDCTFILELVHCVHWCSWLLLPRHHES